MKWEGTFEQYGIFIVSINSLWGQNYANQEKMIKGNAKFKKPQKQVIGQKAQ